MDCECDNRFLLIESMYYCPDCHQFHYDGLGDPLPVNEVELFFEGIQKENEGFMDIMKSIRDLNE